MKVFSVYGETKSVVAAVAGNIVRELAGRGFTVGYIRDAAGERDRNDGTRRKVEAFEKAACAEIVCVRDGGQTKVTFSRELPLDEILNFYHQDYVVLEGFGHAAVPGILCAAAPGDIPEAMEDTVFAISGPIAGTIKEYRGLPVVDAFGDIKSLVDIVEEKVFEKLPGTGREDKCGLCGKTCRRMAADIVKGRARRQDCRASGDFIEVKINGKSLEMMPFVKNTVTSVIKGLLCQLKGYEEGDISINIRKE
ncbi:hypothetical protein [Thermoanaerobacterium sp. DL9XJH110]|uniref:hypothetical protein n=1 Tax=Thermoanaerobacterium sp. DL9XJH110 TaxID=3386643 RepID=UPI003BB49F41